MYKRITKQPYNSTTVHCLRSLCVVAECTSSCSEVEKVQLRILCDICCTSSYNYVRSFIIVGITVNTEKRLVLETIHKLYIALLVNAARTEVSIVPATYAKRCIEHEDCTEQDRLRLHSDITLYI